MAGRKTLAWAGALFPLALVLGCGMGPFAGEGGGADNLPSAGAGPYTSIPADFDTPAEEPFVYSQPIVELLDPAVLAAEAGGFHIYYTKIEDDRSEIWRVYLPEVGALIEGLPERVLEADVEWEEGQVGGASLVEDGQDLLLYYYAGETNTGIGRARSSNGGQSFTKELGNPLVVGAIDPYVVLHGERWFMVSGNADGSALALREGDDGITFSEPTEILRPRRGVDTAFDQLELRAPALDVKTTLDGGLHFGVFYSGLGYGSGDDPLESIGYIGSFDGLQWQRFMAGEPILQPGPGGAGGAAPLVGPSRSLLFYHQPRQGRGQIALATSP